jgi:integral membrane sensor domain MASE1
MRNLHEPTYSFVILTFILIIVDTLLAWFSVRFFPSGAAEVSWFFIAVAFMILFTLWFGAYGAIAAYVGTLAGSGFFASDRLLLHPEVAIIWAIAGLISVLIPLVAFRTLKVDLSLEKRRDWILFFLFGVLINTIAGAAWGTLTLSLGNIIKTGEIFGIFSTWVIGSFIATILIVPLALRYFTPKIRRSKLFVSNYWE